MSDRGSSALSPHYTVLSSSLLRQFLNFDRTPVPVILNELRRFRVLRAGGMADGIRRSRCSVY